MKFWIFPIDLKLKFIALRCATWFSTLQVSFQGHEAPSFTTSRSQELNVNGVIYDFVISSQASSHATDNLCCAAAAMQICYFFAFYHPTPTQPQFQTERMHARRSIPSRHASTSNNKKSYFTTKSAFGENPSRTITYKSSSLNTRCQMLVAPSSKSLLQEQVPNAVSHRALSIHVV